MSTVATSRQSRIVSAIDQEAAAFADEHGLWQDLELALGLVKNAFPGLVKVQVGHVVDPEIPDYGHLRVQSTVIGDLEEILDSEDAFFAALCARMAAERRWFFTFTVIPV